MAGSQRELTSVRKVVVEWPELIVALPGYLDPLAAGAEPALAGTDRCDVQAAVAVDYGDGGLEEQQVGEAHLLAGVLVYVLVAVLVGVVEAVVGVVVEAHGLVGVECEAGVLSFARALLNGVVGEDEPVVVLSALMLQVKLALGDGVHELGAVGKEAVLQAVVNPVRVAGEGCGGVSLADAVYVVPAGGRHEAVCGLAAARVDNYGVVGEGALGIVRPQ